MIICLFPETEHIEAFELSKFRYDRFFFAWRYKKRIPENAELDEDGGYDGEYEEDPLYPFNFVDDIIAEDKRNPSALTICCGGDKSVLDEIHRRNAEFFILMPLDNCWIEYQWLFLLCRPPEKISDYEKQDYFGEYHSIFQNDKAPKLFLSKRDLVSVDRFNKIWIVLQTVALELAGKIEVERQIPEKPKSAIPMSELPTPEMKDVTRVKTVVIDGKTFTARIPPSKEIAEALLKATKPPHSKKKLTGEE